MSTSFQTGHIGINVTRLERAKTFYTRVLNLAVLRESTEEGREFVFLGHEGKLLLTLWKQSEGRFDAARPGLHHLSFEVASIDAVRASEAELRAMGARFLHEGVVAHSEGAASGGIFFEDPDGTRLEIYAPAGAERENAPSGAAPSCGFF